MRKFIHWLIHKEPRLGVSLGRLRELANRSLHSFCKFAVVSLTGSQPKHLPRDAWHVARLVVALNEECGTRVQIVLNLAREDGVAIDVLQAVLTDNVDTLSAECVMCIGSRGSQRAAMKNPNCASGCGSDMATRDSLYLRWQSRPRPSQCFPAVLDIS